MINFRNTVFIIFNWIIPGKCICTSKIPYIFTGMWISKCKIPVFFENSKLLSSQKCNQWHGILGVCTKPMRGVGRSTTHLTVRQVSRMARRFAKFREWHETPSRAILCMPPGCGKQLWLRWQQWTWKIIFDHRRFSWLNGNSVWEWASLKKSLASLRKYLNSLWNTGIL